MKFFPSSVGFFPIKPDIIVLLDISMSMGNKYDSNQVQANLNQIIMNKRIRVLCFNDALINSKNILDQTINTMGNTLLGKTLNQIEKQYGIPKKMLIVTDGKHDNPYKQLRKIKELIECEPKNINEHMLWLLK